MNGSRTSRGGAIAIALGVQSLMVLVLAIGLGIVRAPESDAPALSVALIPVVQSIAKPPASTPRVHLHLPDPGKLLSVPVDITIPAPPAPPPDPVTLLRTTHNESAGATTGTESRIGIVSRVEPDYPQEAVDRRAQGITAVAVLVDANGHPGAVRVMRSSGDAQLDEAAVRAVRKWTFAAATANSQVVPSWGQLEVNFNLTVYRQLHPGLRGGDDPAPDPLGTLTAVIESWREGSGRHVDQARERRNLELLSPALRRLLQTLGPVSTVRFLGVASRPPESVTQSAMQRLRLLDSTSIAGWDEFAVTQQRGTSQWYCAMDAAGQILDILVDGD